MKNNRCNLVWKWRRIWRTGRQILAKRISRSNHPLWAQSSDISIALHRVKTSHSSLIGVQIFWELLNHRRAIPLKSHFGSSGVVTKSFIVILGVACFSRRCQGKCCRPDWDVSYWWISPSSDNVDFVRTSTNSNPPEDILKPDSKFSFTNGIDDRVTQKTGHEDTSGDQYYLSWNFDTRDELTAKTCDPAGDTAQQERCNDDAYIDSGLPLSHSPWYLLAWLIFRSSRVSLLGWRHVVSLKNSHCLEDPPI